MMIACAVLVVGIMATAQTIRVSFQDPASHDFGMSFHPSGRGWIERRQPYAPHERPNLNPPSVTRALFVPLARLDLRSALTLWNAAGAACLAATWLLLYVNGLRPASLVLGSLGALLCTLGAACLVWLEGQLTWILLPVTTLSWLAYRTGRPVVAGAWLGVLVAVKPFFAVAALPLGVAACVAAAAVSLGISAISVLASGIDVWQQWLHSGGEIAWLTRPGNASLWGLAARVRGFGLQDQVQLAGLGPLTLLVVGLLAAALFASAATRRDPSKRWLLAVTAAILSSPLGWSHYVPLVAPPLVAHTAGRWNRALTVSVVLFCVPPGFLYGLDSWFSALTIGSAYGFGLLLLWAGLAATPETPAPAVDKAPR